MKKAPAIEPYIAPSRVYFPRNADKGAEELLRGNNPDRRDDEKWIEMMIAKGYKRIKKGN